MRRWWGICWLGFVKKAFSSLGFGIYLWLSNIIMKAIFVLCFGLGFKLIKGFRMDF